MKHQKAIIAVLSICIVLFILSGGVEYSHTLKQSSQHPSEQMKQHIAFKSTISPIPTGAGNLQETQTWSRYTYENNFRIAYPPFWQVIPDPDGNGVSFMTTGFHQDDDFSMPYGNSFDVSYSIFGEHDTSDMTLKDGDRFPSDTTSETMVVTNLKHIQVAGYPAVSYDYYPTDNTNFIRSRVSIEKNNTMYRFTATYAQDADKNLFLEMIDTLQFLQK